MKPYIKLMRVHHYIKNFLVFAALACSGQFFHPEKLLAGVLGFAAFCMVSSVVYIINDIRDVEKDRAHPTKCKRPIAAGTVSVRNACILAVVLVIGAAVCNCLVFRWESTALLALYLVLNLAYSFGLKNVPIVDITILVAGFLIRILYGALATDIVISNWLYLTVIAISFFFALGKRRNELKQLGISLSGNFLKLEFDFVKNGAPIAKVRKKFLSWGDSYELEFSDPSLELVLLACIMMIQIVCAIQRRRRH